MKTSLPLCWALALVPAVLAMACPRKDAVAPAVSGQPPGQVHLVFTANVRGWVEPCGCTTDPLGGVDRIRGELMRLEKTAPVLYFDAGNLLFDRTEVPPAAVCQEDARTQLLLDSAVKSGLRFTGLGAFDLARGDAFRAQTLAAHKVPAVSANITAPSILPRHMVEVAGIKVGFTGVTWPEKTPMPPEDAASLAWNGLQLLHPVKSVARQAGLLRQEGAHVVVVLGAMPRALLAELAQKVPGLDVVVVAHEPGEEPAAPEEVARGTWMLAAGQQGQHLGVATLTMPALGQSCCLALDDGGRGALQEAERLTKRAGQLLTQAAEFEVRKDATNALARRTKAAELQSQAQALRAAGAAPVEGNRLAFRTVALNSSVAPDPTVSQALRTYKDSLTQLNTQCEKGITCPPAPTGTASYVGSNVCSSCHADATAFWQKATVVDPVRAKQYAAVPNHPNAEGRLGHVRAWKTLEEAKATGNRDCIACHSVGFEQPGGFCKIADGPTWGAVGCESCHGPGSRHVESENAADIRRNVPENTCRTCHHVPHILSTESFVYREKLRVILGPGHGEEALKRLGASP